MPAFHSSGDPAGSEKGVTRANSVVITWVYGLGQGPGGSSATLKVYFCASATLKMYFCAVSRASIPSLYS